MIRIKHELFWNDIWNIISDKVLLEVEIPDYIDLKQHIKNNLKNNIEVILENGFHSVNDVSSRTEWNDSYGSFAQWYIFLVKNWIPR